MHIFLIIAIAVALTNHVEPTSSILLSKLLQAPERIDSSKTEVDNADLVVCTPSGCLKVPKFKVVLSSLTCNNHHLEITFTVLQTNGSTSSFSGFLERNHGFLANKQQVSSNCLVIKRFFISKEQRIVCVDEICSLTPTNQMDYVIIMELLKQLRIISLVVWTFGYYHEETASIFYYSALKVYIFIFYKGLNILTS